MCRFLFLFASFLLLTSCAPQQADSTSQPIRLTPFLTSTSAPLPTPFGLVAPITPLPSPTPFTYVIQKNDTLSEIAERFGVSIDDLQAANPQISANAMPIGEVLLIPSNSNNLSGESTPTPAPLTLEQSECYPTVDGGVWCFILVRNDSLDLIENVSAQITLIDANGAAFAAQTAFLMLDILPPNTSLPVMTFFPNAPFDAKPQAQILTAIQALSNDGRYILTTTNNTLIQVDAGGHSAQVSGLILSQDQTVVANQIWVAATAYDDVGRIVGVRRWEARASLPPGGSLPFQFLISSAGGRIARVEFVVEARP